MAVITLKVRKQKLVGNYDRVSDRAILMIHGFRGDRTEGGRFTGMAETLKGAGFSVLRIDCRGSGESEGDFFDMTIMSEVEDTLAAIKFLRKEGMKKIGLIGHSLGGEVSILAASQEGIDALGLTSPVVSSEIFIKKFDQKMKDFGNYYEYKRGNGKRGKVGKAFVRESKELRVEDVAGSLDVPILIVGGELDKITPIEYAKNFVSHQSNASLIVLPMEHHNFSEKGTEYTAGVFSNWFNRVFDM